MKEFKKLFIKVRDHMKWNDEKTLHWFATENPLLGGCTPSQLWFRRPEKLKAWVDSVIDEGKPNEINR